MRNTGEFLRMRSIGMPGAEGYEWEGLRSSPCNLCPRECGARREKGQAGYCLSDNRIFVARAALHMWEEPCISGDKGSGTVFFTGCSLRCVYCQNYEITGGQVSAGSQESIGNKDFMENKDSIGKPSTKNSIFAGKQVSIEKLGKIFLKLQEMGAANINLVTPDHHVTGIARAVLEAKQNGLVIPVVYNGSGYEKREVIRNLSGIIDIFLTDFKYMDGELAGKYSFAPDYPEVAKGALEEMVRTVGSPVFDGKGMMRRGVIVRHLLLPGHKKNAKKVISYVYETYKDKVFLSLMNQYTPFERVKGKPEFGSLGRKVTKREYDDVVDYAIGLGVKNAFIQEGATAEESFIPAFDGEGVD